MKNPGRGLVSARVVMRQRPRPTRRPYATSISLSSPALALFLAREMVPFHCELFPIPPHLRVSCLAGALITHNGAHPMHLGFVGIIHCYSTLASKVENRVVLKAGQGVPLDAHGEAVSSSRRSWYSDRLLSGSRGAKSSLAPSGKTVVYEVPGFFRQETPLCPHPSELVAIARLNGDFHRNYGRLIGAYLYLRSISTVAAAVHFEHGSCSPLLRPS